MKCDRFLLVECVRENPILWDNRNPIFRDKAVKDVKWKLVSSQIGIPVAEAKRVWDNLRDCFRRELKKGLRNKSLDSIKWPFFKPLLFLKDVMMNRYKPVNPLLFSIEASQNVETEEFIKIEEHDIDEALNTPTTSPFSITTYDAVSEAPFSMESCDVPSNGPTVSSFSMTKGNAASNTQSFDDNLSHSESKRGRFEESQNQDEDYYFVMSILPSLRKIKDDKKLELKIEIMSLIKNAS